jgi:hypothetical protein
MFLDKGIPKGKVFQMFTDLPAVIGYIGGASLVIRMIKVQKAGVSLTMILAMAIPMAIPIKFIQNSALAGTSLILAGPVNLFANSNTATRRCCAYYAS